MPTYANSSDGSFPVASNYNLKISKDSVISCLSYYGSSHFSLGDPANGNIKFSWINYSYTIRQGIKGNLEVKIGPEGKSKTAVSDVQSIRLRISPDRSASLQVITFNRGSTSFDGYLAAKY